MYLRALHGRFGRGRPIVSLKSLLSLVFGLAGLASAAIVATAAQRESAYQLRDRIDAELQSKARFIAERLDRAMFIRWRDLQLAVAMPSLQNGDVADDERRRLLERLQKTLENYVWIGVVGLDGRIQVATDPAIEHADVSRYDWFRTGLVGPTVGDVHSTSLLSSLPAVDTAGRPLRLLDVAAPIHDTSGAVTGVIAAQLNWSWAEEIASHYTDQPVSEPETLIIAADGRILLGPPDLVGRQASELTSEGWMTGSAATQGYRDYPGVGWNVVVRQSVQSALAPVNELTRHILLWSISVALALALVGFYLAGLIVQPLARLSKAAHRLSRGEIVPLPRKLGYLEALTLSSALSSLVTSLRSASRLHTADRRDERRHLGLARRERHDPVEQQLGRHARARSRGNCLRPAPVERSYPSRRRTLRLGGHARPCRRAYRAPRA